jgi:hypothetical protein
MEKETMNDTTSISRDFLQDLRISCKARGLLCYLLSFPDRKDLTITTLSTELAEGKESIRSAYTELIAVGYLTRYQTQGEWIYKINPDLVQSVPKVPKINEIKPSASAPRTQYRGDQNP